MVRKSPNSLRRAFRHLWIWSSFRRKVPVEAISIFHRLPTELILLIVSFLPEASAASFTLCNRFVMRSLGTQYFEKPKDQREGFLLLLEKDLPEHVYCYRCKYLHRPRTADIPEDRSFYRTKRPCQKAGRNLLSFDYFIRNFYFIQLQLIMKRYRLGLDLTAYLNTFRATVTQKNDGGYNYQWSTEPRIINGEFYLRSQHWQLLPKTPHTAEELESLFYWRLHNRNLCCHHNSQVDLRYRELMGPVNCKINHWCSTNSIEAATCLMCSGITRCFHCPMEFQVDMQEFDKKRVAIVVTCWRVYGRCETPLDPKWNSYFESPPWCARAYLKSEHVCHRCENFRYTGVAGDLKAEYEQGKDFHVDILSSKNRKVLSRSAFIEFKIESWD